MSYHELCEKLCPDYMAMGMTWDEYWHGDSEMPIYFRRANEMRERQQNYTLWMQGVYIYHALLDASPVFHSLAKNPKPFPYLNEPLPLNKKEREEKEKRQEEEQDKKNQATVRAWAERVNRLKAEKQKGVQSDGRQ